MANKIQKACKRISFKGISTFPMDPLWNGHYWSPSSLLLVYGRKGKEVEGEGTAPREEKKDMVIYLCV